MLRRKFNRHKWKNKIRQTNRLILGIPEVKRFFFAKIAEI